jgi:hypothetical protein
MAELQGEAERARQLIAEAEELSPGHPAVAVAEARASADAQGMLDRLSDVEEPEDKDDRVLLHIVRGQGYLGQGEIENAQRELDTAKAANEEHAAVAEFEANLVWWSAKANAAEGIDQRAVREAAEKFVSLAEELDQQERHAVAAEIRGRAAECFALAGTPADGARILQAIADPGGLELRQREDLANAAMLTRRPDLVSTFITDEDDSPLANLLRADATLFGDSDEVDRASAVEALEALLASDDDGLRAQAAYALISGASLHLDVPWSEEAARIVGDEKPRVEAVIRAERQRLDGDREGAEATLLAHASDPNVLRQLRDYAAQDEDWTTARDRSRRLYELTSEPRDRLGLADTSRRAGDNETAEREFLALARSTDVPMDIRASAYAGAMEIVGSDRNYTAIRDLAAEWHAQLPESANGTWNLLFGLARLARHAEAYAIAKEERPDADLPERALLLAEILYRAAPKIDAMERIAELSDQFNREVEGLEASFLQASIGAEQAGEALPEALAERTRETWANFRTRFPDTEFVQVFEAPTTAEEFADLMREVGAADSAKAQKEALGAVVQGMGPVNAVAAVSPGGRIGRTWLRLGSLPLGFAVDESDKADRATAATALGGAAVWDAASLFVTGGLGAEHAERVIGALPGSVLVNDALEDVDQAQSSAASRGQMETAVDPEDDDAVSVHTLSEQEVARERAMAEGMLDLARRLRAEPGLSGGSDSQFAELYGLSPDVSWRALTATLALAERLTLPVFSDDRWIREQARGMGIPAFGTAALLDVLEERGVITTDERTSLRRRLIRSNAWGIRPTRDELISFATEVDWDVSPELVAGFNDRAVWRAQPVFYWHEVFGFLEAVFENKPEAFRIWLLRSIDSFLRAMEEFPDDSVVELLLLSAWPLDEREDRLSQAAFRRLVWEVKHLPPWVPVGPEPVLSAIAALLDFFNDEPAEVRVGIFRQIVNRLEWSDQMLAYFRLVGPPVQATSPPPPPLGGSRRRRRRR